MLAWDVSGSPETPVLRFTPARTAILLTVSFVCAACFDDGGKPLRPGSNAGDRFTTTELRFSGNDTIADIGNLMLVPAAGDSSGKVHWVAAFGLRGAPGGSVMLRLDAARSAIQRGGDALRILVSAGGVEKWYSFRELSLGQVVFTFRDSGDATVKYGLRRTGALGRAGSVNLVQQLRRVSVLRADAPWAPATRLRASRAAALTAGSGDTNCAISSPDSPCPVRVGISPFFTQEPADSTAWGSVSCCGVSTRDSVTFSAPVSSVTITAVDPDFAGNSVIAYDANDSVIASAEFAVDNLPDHLTYSTVTLTASGIRRLELVPGPLDWVAYKDMTITFPPVLINCPTGDSILDNPFVRSEMQAALRDARTTGPDSARHEVAAFLLRSMADSSLVFQRVVDSTATNCQTRLSATFPPGYEVVAVYHVHPYAPGDFIYACGGKPIANGPGVYQPNWHGGAGPRDWEALDSLVARFQSWGFPPPRFYIIDARRVYRLAPTVPVSQRSKNKYVYDHNTPSCSW